MILKQGSPAGGSLQDLGVVVSVTLIWSWKLLVLSMLEGIKNKQGVSV